MSISLKLEVVKGDAELNMDAKEISIADLQAALANLELVKMNLLGQLVGMTEIHKTTKEKEGEYN